MWKWVLFDRSLGRSYHRHLSLLDDRLSPVCHPSLSLPFTYPGLQCLDYLVSFSSSRALSSCWCEYKTSVAWEIKTDWYMTRLVSLQWYSLVNCRWRWSLKYHSTVISDTKQVNTSLKSREKGILSGQNGASPPNKTWSTPLLIRIDA